MWEEEIDTWLKESVYSPNCRHLKQGPESPAQSLAHIRSQERFVFAQFGVTKAKWLRCQRSLIDTNNDHSVITD